MDRWGYQKFVLAEPCRQDLGQVVMEVHDLDGRTLAELGLVVAGVPSERCQ